MNTVKYFRRLVVCMLSMCEVASNAWSDMFRITFGVRQGSILSPFLFAVYLDDLSKSCDRKRNVFIILYADDILLLAISN